MNIKIFQGFEDKYIEKVDETNSWYYSQWTPCAAAYEVPDFKNTYPGTKLHFIEYPSGKVFEPIKQERNVYLERPVYEYKENSFGIIRYDFNNEIMQILIFKPECSSVKVLAEIPFSKLGNMVSVRLITSPFALVKYNFQDNTVDFLWPKKMHIQLEEYEGVDFQNEGKLYMSKLIEDADYHQEIIIRSAENGKILERIPGYLKRMPDGSIWKMTL